ncbi:MAG TPA: hypothetical protein VGF24_30640 [Vicinamibacterales bacterium]
MRSLVVAMLWENWRVTRVEAAQRLVLGIVLGAAVPAVAAAFGSIDDGAARVALTLLVMTHAPLWLSVAKLNGGRFMDGYRPGYPFYFLYTRPVRTFVLVGAPMAYNAASAVAVYIVAALVLRAAFGYPFLSLPLAALVAAFHLAQWAVQWGTSNKVAQWVGSLTLGLGFTALAVWRAREWPARFDLSIGDYALLAAIGVASFGLTVAGVARQRRGDARAAVPRTVTAGGFSNWFAGLFRFPCPTSSATRAQIWFDLRSSGLAVLTIGVALAIVIPLLFVVTPHIDVMLSGSYTRPATRVVAVVVAMFSVPAVLLFGGNAFGIRTRQGRRYASVFEAAQPNGTARIAGLKVVVRSVCLLAALVSVGTSVWTSASFMPFDVLDDDTLIEEGRSPLSGWMRAIEGAVGALSAYELLALAFVMAIGVGVMVALRAAHPALRARYARRLNIAGWSLLLHGLVLVLLALAVQRGIGSPFVLHAILIATKWIAAAAILLATLYFAWRTFAERLLTRRSACVAVLVFAAFGAAWVTVLQAAGVQLAGMPTTDAVWMLWPVLLPPMATVMAPWSLNRIRHT